LNFRDFNLDNGIIEGIEAMGYENPTPVQEQVIPSILDGKDIIAAAQTGTGKTAAFLLPIIHQIITGGNLAPIKALVIVPTRELARQIDQHMEGLAYFSSVHSLAIYGGSGGEAFSREKKALSVGTDVVICTPGRMIAHLNLGYVKFSGLQYLILDEADRMLDMGFNEDIMKIISFLPKKRQNLLFSATMPSKIRQLARQVLNDPAEINIAISKPAENIIQVAFIVYENQKIPLVLHLLTARELRSILVFCSTKVSTKALSRELKKNGLQVEDIHSDLDQASREKVLINFKNRKTKILVATDVLSRGIDIEDINLVINYDVPHDAEDYIHRIGRTARAEAAGAAFTLVSQKEQGKFSQIEDHLGKPVTKAKIPENLGKAPDYKPRKPGRKGKPFRRKKRR